MAELWTCRDLLQSIHSLFGAALVNLVPLHSPADPLHACSVRCELAQDSSHQIVVAVLPARSVASAPAPCSSLQSLHEFLGPESLSPRSPAGRRESVIQDDESTLSMLRQWAGEGLEVCRHEGGQPMEEHAVEALARGEPGGAAGVAPLHGVVLWQGSCFVLCASAPFSLRSVFTKFRPLPRLVGSDLQRRFVLLQLVSTLAQLHAANLVHGALAPEIVHVSPKEAMAVAIGLPGSAAPGSRASAAALADQACARWSRGELSNFDYLLLLNNMAGRRVEDPQMQPVMPWVIDFKSKPILEDPCAECWRDLSKSKYRLTKGEEHLDFTYGSATPHHITDHISEVTFSIYNARRMRKMDLCRIVRSNFEPNEYPSSLDRLYDWTPDEAVSYTHLTLPTKRIV
eukprot:TRINITY_DN50432_c0_g1_i1.p1 TRINITY_DN50432_c0_g1~~TRINITY_DN50432_c0_g1_i1.p1  ORF type:complete len:400 (+),score=57.93 TRINITY_DN50432_c0_g1_i1:156-1355(+)